jgi:hypothetical protein
VSLPTGRLDVVQLAVPGVPEVTGVVPQPVFELQVTLPVTVMGLLPFTCPYWPGIVAVKVTG